MRRLLAQDVTVSDDLITGSPHCNDGKLILLLFLIAESCGWTIDAQTRTQFIDASHTFHVAVEIWAIYYVIGEYSFPYTSLQL